MSEGKKMRCRRGAGHGGKGQGQGGCGMRKRLRLRIRKMSCPRKAENEGAERKEEITSAGVPQPR